MSIMLGADGTSAGLAIGTPATSATFSSLKAYPNVNTTYGTAAGVYTSLGTNSYQIRMRPVSFSNDNADKFKFITFEFKDGSTTMAMLNYTSNGAEWTVPSTADWASSPISPLATWSVAIETQAADYATSGSVNIVIAIDVQ